MSIDDGEEETYVCLCACLPLTVDVHSQEHQLVACNDSHPSQLRNLDGEIFIRARNKHCINWDVKGLYGIHPMREKKSRTIFEM